MTALAYYSTIVKKEDILERISVDVSNAASVANDLVCDLKAASVASSTKNVEALMDHIKASQQLIATVNAMVDNLNSNVNAYIQSLLTKPQNQEEKVQQLEQNVESSENEQAVPLAPTRVDEQQLGNIMEAIKALKEMKESLPK